MSVVRALACGVLAGAGGTLAMDALWFVRYRRGGGQSDPWTWESAAGLNSWDDASAPAKVGKLLYESARRQPLPASRARLTTNLMHWAYGLQWGVVFSLAIGSRRHLRPWQGPLLGGLVWLSSYLALPIAGVYQPIWRYSPKTLWQDLSAHLVYGTTVAAAFWKACGA
jgi:hypothetical protein